jgi:hypothetical protein
MANKIANIKLATSTWAQKYATRTDLRFALVTAPDNDQFYGSRPRLFKDFTDSKGFVDAMSQQVGKDGSGEEPTIDALWWLAIPANPMNISWKAPNKRVIIVFSDEDPQSYLSPPIAVPDALNQLATSLETVYVFTTVEYFPVWNVFPMRTNGLTWDIESTSQAIQSDLDTLITNLTCK